MELKLGCTKVLFFVTASLNCTIMELKSLKKIVPLRRRMVLIVPLWN